ncbi:MAG: cysteine--tRNA ligase, partial [Actinomycetota bacterium]
IYACGPTVYGNIHVGNARPFVFFAVLERYLRHSGYEVTLVENLTDVDDKIIDRANEEGVSPDEVASRYSEAYFEDTDRLGLGRPDIEPRATEHIPEIIDLCRELVEKGYAYESGGSVYYRVREFKEYGKLSRQKTDQMKHCEVPREGEAKESPLDFAVWKAAKPGEPSWESPWGPGRPGWHIECTAMSLKYLGSGFDIHGGGRDLIFPHHENEIAQTEAATGAEFARYWMHNGMITKKEEKMSKSVGNIFLLREFLKKYDPRVLILFFMGSHYRSPLEFSLENIEEAAGQLERFKNCLWKVDSVLGEVESTGEGAGKGAVEAAGDETGGAAGDVAGAATGEGVAALTAATRKAEQKFDDEMEDDANTAGALAAVFGLVKAINEYAEAASVTGKVAVESLKGARDRLTELLGLLGVEIKPEEYREAALEQELQELVELRELCRREGRYEEADEARDKILAAGYEVRDTPQGPKLVKL